MAQRSGRVEPPGRYWNPFPDGALAELTAEGQRVGLPGWQAARALGPIIQAVVEARAEKGWSRAALGRRAGVTQQTVWNIENGTTWPDFVTLVGLCEALGLDLALSARE